MQSMMKTHDVFIQFLPAFEPEMRINDTPALPAPLLNAKMVRCCFFACCGR
jgi:hypothetical protein